MTIQELQAVSEAIANQAEVKFANHRHAVIVMDGRGWNVRENGLPLFICPVEHRVALRAADAVNVAVTR